MFKNVSLGRYYDTGSVLHNTDPRVKIVLYLIYLIITFMINTWAGLLSLALITVLQGVAAKMPPKIMISSVRPVILLALFIFALNAFTQRQGTPVFQKGIIMVTDEGLKTAFFMSLRLIFLIMSTSILLTLTTTPLKISDALEKMFSPLSVIKFPVHEMAMMMSIALRFIPTLIDETDKIMKAQASRGADYDTGNIISRVKGYITVLIPLFISSFKRAEELATAMDARCYRGGEGRTKLNPLKLTGRDAFVALIMLIGAGLILAADFLVK
ncbi:MAG: energy-coupling factor transporter transmembrane protein EcfT [Clostridiales bacterium]|nr:energy-coupling factor transporter transmembrane protein EcfT [Clostridiales bacterium]